MSRVKNIARRWTARAIAASLRRRSRPLPAVDGVLLVIAPHPDDETLGCGGLIARQARQGRRVHVLFLTDGEASHGGHPVLVPAALAAQRRDEALAALAALGVANPSSTATFLGAPDGQLDRLPAEDRAGLRDVLTKWMRADRPEVVTVPFRADGSSEHDAAAVLVREALAAAGGGELWEYPIWAWWNALRLRERTAAAADNLRLELGDLLPAKRQALARYRSQVEPTPPWPEPVLPAAIAQACSGGVEFYFRHRVEAR